MVEKVFYFYRSSALERELKTKVASKFVSTRHGHSDKVVERY
jgi:hypothetical protein